MMMEEMRIRPGGTGPTNWILFCPWWDMPWVWEMCGDSHILLSRMVEVRNNQGHHIRK